MKLSASNDISMIFQGTVEERNSKFLHFKTLVSLTCLHTNALKFYSLLLNFVKITIQYKNYEKIPCWKKGKRIPWWLWTKSTGCSSGKQMLNKTSEIRPRTRRNHTKDEFDMRLKQIISEFAEKSLLNVVPFWENEDPATYVSFCPTSAHTGDGMGYMMWYKVNFCQNHLKKRLAFRSEPQATVLEIKEIQGLGTTIDIILVNGKLKEADSIVVAGYEGPIQTHVEALLAPPAMKGSRMKSQYEFLKQSQIPYSGINIGPVYKKMWWKLRPCWNTTNSTASFWRSMWKWKEMLWNWQIARASKFLQ